MSDDHFKADGIVDRQFGFPAWIRTGKSRAVNRSQGV
jgi:hypothetical protein